MLAKHFNSSLKGRRHGEFSKAITLNMTLGLISCTRYRFDGRLTSAHAIASPFRRVADKAGIFSIVSIAHKQDRCQNTIADLNFRIHSIPSAKVSHGKRVVENIREGMITCYSPPECIDK